MSVYTLPDTIDIEESTEMASFNHGYVQARLIVLFDGVGKYTPISELSLDISGIDLSKFDINTKTEIKPDVSLYPKRGLSRPTDILPMSEMPLLVVEIISPRQGTYEILEKFKVYFELGIQSCWFVEPAVNIVTVYSSMDDWKTFSSGEIVDGKFDIRLSIEEIFS